MERGNRPAFYLSLLLPNTTEENEPRREKNSEVQCRSLSLVNLRMQNHFSLSLSSSQQLPQRWRAYHSPLRKEMSGKLIPRMRLTQFSAFSVKVTHIQVLDTTKTQSGCKLIHITFVSNSPTILYTTLTCSFNFSLFGLRTIQIFQNRDSHSRATQKLNTTYYANLIIILKSIPWLLCSF